MARRTSESARILNFFSAEPMDKATVVYELVQDVMRKRMRPAKEAEKTKRALSKKVKDLVGTQPAVPTA